MTDVQKIDAFRTKGQNPVLTEEDGKERTGQLALPDEDGNVYVEVFGTNPFRVKLTEGDAAFLRTVEPQFYDPALDINTEGLTPVEIVDAYAAAHAADKLASSTTEIDPEFLAELEKNIAAKFGLKLEKDLQPPLKAYKVGENVEVDRGGDWIPGKITSIEKSSGYLNVYTERGELSVGSSHRVRKVG